MRSPPGPLPTPVKKTPPKPLSATTRSWWPCFWVHPSQTCSRMPSAPTRGLGLYCPRARARRVTSSTPSAGSTSRDAPPRVCRGVPTPSPRPIRGRPRGPSTVDVPGTTQPPTAPLEPAPEVPGQDRAPIAHTIRRMCSHRGVPSTRRSPSGRSLA
ncbi:hypothetical protein KM043_013364 [Ampulex compressa]|nr:hypothetical protein KM043_013364 [Ampulex compressa]